jgi:phage anti-repressor protein
MCISCLQALILNTKLTIKFDQPTLVAEDLHKDLKVSTRYDMWIGRIIKKYGFQEGMDFCTILGESSGGRRPTQHHITFNMAKEICMLDSSEVGRKIRLSYIRLEEEVKKQKIQRLVGMEARKGLTDKIKESGENERMHGYAYSSYTTLVYKICGVEFKKCKNFRETLSADELERVKSVEKMIDGLLSMGNKYDQIKDGLNKLLSFKKGDA